MLNTETESKITQLVDLLNDVARQFCVSKVQDSLFTKNSVEFITKIPNRKDFRNHIRAYVHLIKDKFGILDVKEGENDTDYIIIKQDDDIFRIALIANMSDSIDIEGCFKYQICVNSYVIQKIHKN